MRGPTQNQQRLAHYRHEAGARHRRLSMCAASVTGHGFPRLRPMKIPESGAVKSWATDAHSSSRPKAVITRQVVTRTRYEPFFGCLGALKGLRQPLF